MTSFTLRSHSASQHGVTLIELVVFLVIIGIALSATVNVFTGHMRSVNDPLIRVRALELATAQMDEILSRKFDENTPTGGVPACNSTEGSACLGIVADGDYDDVGDFNGFTDTSVTGYQVSVTVSAAGTDLGLAAADARLISVVVTTPVTGNQGLSDVVTLSAYKVNF